MRPAKRHLAVVVFIVLITGLSYSQVCILDCSFNEGSKNKSVSRQNEQPGHCHQKRSEPVSPERKRSSGCPSHAELSALMTSALAAVKISNGDLQAEAEPLRGNLVLILSPDRPTPEASDMPLRAPPTHPVLRI